MFALKFTFIFLAQLLAILNSYLYTVCPMAILKWSAFLREDLQPCKIMTDTLAPVERTNWALSAWNSTLDRNDVCSAWLYGQDHLWATGHLVSSPGGFFHLPPHPSLSSHPPTPL